VKPAAVADASEKEQLAFSQRALAGVPSGGAK